MANKSVTIPESMNPFTVEINGVKYSYTPGEMVSVPEDVAAVIDNLNALQPKEEGYPIAGMVMTISEEGNLVWRSLPQGVTVAEATGETPTASEFNALLDSLKDAGLIAKS